MADSRQEPTDYDWPVYDKELLAKLATAAIADRFDSLRDAARHTELSIAFLSRITNKNNKKRLKQIGDDNFFKLHALIPEDQHHLLDQVFIPAGARVLSVQYESWIQTALAVVSQGTGSRLVRTAEGFKRGSMYTRFLDAFANSGQTVRDDERAALWEYVRSKKHGLVEEAERLFYEHPEPHYRTLALARILDPLLNAPESGFIETSWRELALDHPDQLFEFVGLGIKREKLLLRRRPIWQRMVQVFTLPFGELVRRFGENATKDSE